MIRRKTVRNVEWKYDDEGYVLFWYSDAIAEDSHRANVSLWQCPMSLRSHPDWPLGPCSGGRGMSSGITNEGWLFDGGLVFEKGKGAEMLEYLWENRRELLEETN